jgi:stalled ribosome rescue protein Dom34
MSVKHKKQFGVWMDGHHATIVGRDNNEGDTFVVLGHSKNDGISNTNHGESKQAEQTKMHTFFKDIAHHMQNAEEIHLTGTGTAQEQFTHYLKDTPQFKNVSAKDSTSNKMNDEQLVAFISEKFI